MNQYVQVVEEEGDEPIELPAEEDGSLLLSTLVAQFPGSSGLKYRSTETNGVRGVRLADGRLFAPDGVWGGITFITVYPKAVSVTEKRKGDLLDTPTPKTKKIDKQKCSDLIVLGLPWKCNEDDLRSHFSQFGELIMVQVKRNISTNQSKGFGFIRFADYDSQLKALSQRHLIDNRWCDIRIPNSKEGAQLEVNQKVYVGRCTEDMTAEDLRSYFQQFGEVNDVFVPKPFRAFAFVTFSDPEVAQSLCGDDHVIKGNSVHLSCATPKNVERYTDRVMQVGRGFGKGGDGWIPDSSRGRGGGSGSSSSFALGGSYGMGGSGGASGGAGGPFQMNPAMMAAAQAAFAQGLLGMMGMNQGSSSGHGGYSPGTGADSSGKAAPSGGTGGFGGGQTTSGESQTGGGGSGYSNSQLQTSSYGSTGGMQGYNSWSQSHASDGHGPNSSWSQTRAPGPGWN